MIRPYKLSSCLIHTITYYSLSHQTNNVIMTQDTSPTTHFHCFLCNFCVLLCTASSICLFICNHFCLSILCIKLLCTVHVVYFYFIFKRDHVHNFQKSLHSNTKKSETQSGALGACRGVQGLETVVQRVILPCCKQNIFSEFLSEKKGAF